MVLIVTFLTGLLNVLVNLILIPNFGVKGALIGTGSSNLISIGILFVMINRKIKLKYPLYLLIKIISASIAAVWMSNLIAPHSFISLIFSALIFGSVYIGIVAVLKPFEKIDAQNFETVPVVHRCMTFIAR